jgi:hypothetical protein
LGPRPLALDGELDILSIIYNIMLGWVGTGALCNSGIAFCIVFHLAHRQELICRWLCGRCVQHKRQQQQHSSSSTRSSLVTKKRQNVPEGGHTVRMRPCGARLPHEAYIRTNVNACTLCRLFYPSSCTPSLSRRFTTNSLTAFISFFFSFSRQGRPCNSPRCLWCWTYA